jgi:hypothetical protein
VGRRGAVFVAIGAVLVACGVIQNGALDLAPVTGGDAASDGSVAVVTADGSVSVEETDAGGTDAANDADAELPRTATPVFSPVEGTYFSSLCVGIASATPGAAIHVTMDGTVPTSESAVYAPPMVVRTSGDVRAIAVAPGLRPSEVASAHYEIQGDFKTNDPTFSKPGGEYATGVSVALATSTAGAALCYTTDGTDPQCGFSPLYCPDVPPCGLSSLAYAGPISLGASAQPIVVRAISCSKGNTPSEMISGTFVFRVASVSLSSLDNITPGYLPTSNTLGMNIWAPSGTLDLDVKPGDVATPDETLRYSYATGASLPAPPDVTCDQACDVPSAACTSCAGSGCKTGALAAGTTVKAIGCASDYVASPLRQVVFADPAKYPVLALPAPDPANAYATAKPITLTATSGATICFTMGKGNTVDPTCSPATGACTTTGALPAGVVAATYDGASDATKPKTADGATLRAIACKAGLPNPSNVVSATYRAL